MLRSYGKKHLKVQRIELEYDRIVAVKIGTKNQRYVFYSVYLPSTNSSLADFREIVHCLESLCIKLKYNEDKIAYDFNAHAFESV